MDLMNPRAKSLMELNPENGGQAIGPESVELAFRLHADYCMYVRLNGPKISKGFTIYGEAVFYILVGSSIIIRHNFWILLARISCIFQTTDFLKGNVKTLQ
ncbi:hypothetical protein NPIL_600041 [Nephila pilipes]|uniref:Uncharacterized protein n=1 Tax=Nephila pilipes TaxID=299642 RepID=A0A8X6N373_NEPPI|nr:hypothetical protein NPIL_141241 [Nephila pilipes]GFT13096.1 hypothetical protein NPIL_600041 [Nephila pilipes]